jgi:hypothetical protein
LRPRPIEYGHTVCIKHSARRRTAQRPAR